MNNLNKNMRKPMHVKQEQIQKIDQIKKLILGKTYNEALKIYKNLRIVTKDDKNITIILNYCHDRCNVIIKHDIIVDIHGFY
jgi:hypothetical protein